MPHLLAGGRSRQVASSSMSSILIPISNKTEDVSSKKKNPDSSTSMMPSKKKVKRDENEMAALHSMLSLTHSTESRMSLLKQPISNNSNGRSTPAVEDEDSISVTTGKDAAAVTPSSTPAKDGNGPRPPVKRVYLQQPKGNNNASAQRPDQGPHPSEKAGLSQGSKKQGRRAERNTPNAVHPQSPPSSSRNGEQGKGGGKIQRLSYHGHPVHSPHYHPSQAHNVHTRGHPSSPTHQQGGFYPPHPMCMKMGPRMGQDGHFFTHHPHHGGNHPSSPSRGQFSHGPPHHPGPYYGPHSPHHHPAGAGPPYYPHPQEGYPHHPYQGQPPYPCGSHQQNKTNDPPSSSGSAGEDAGRKELDREDSKLPKCSKSVRVVSPSTVTRVSALHDADRPDATSKSPAATDKNNNTNNNEKEESKESLNGGNQVAPMSSLPSSPMRSHPPPPHHYPHQPQPPQGSRMPPYEGPPYHPANYHRMSHHMMNCGPMSGGSNTAGPPFSYHHPHGPTPPHHPSHAHPSYGAGYPHHHPSYHPHHYPGGAGPPPPGGPPHSSHMMSHHPHHSHPGAYHPHHPHLAMSHPSAAVSSSMAPPPSKSGDHSMPSGSGAPPNSSSSAEQHHRHHNHHHLGEIKSVAQWQKATQMTGMAPSTNRCVPLKAPIPSKFWGDVEKTKDAYIPDFHQLVNFPDYLPKNLPNTRNNSTPGSAMNNNTSSTHNSNQGGASAGDNAHRHCVMCGKRCLCTASSSSAVIAAHAAAGGARDNSSKGISSATARDVQPHATNTSSIIPRQNKGLCTTCDVTVWVIADSRLEIKWCKGCKNFRPWAAFGEKGLATKCVKCRDRQREKYALQKEDLKKVRKRKHGALTPSTDTTTASQNSNDISSVNSNKKDNDHYVEERQDKVRKAMVGTDSSVSKISSTPTKGSAKNRKDEEKDNRLHNMDKANGLIRVLSAASQV